MVYAKWAKVSKQLTEDEKASFQYTKMMLNDIRKAPENNYRKLLNFAIAYYREHEDNFVRELVTIRITCNSFKAPRIVSRNIQDNYIKKLVRYIKLNN